MSDYDREILMALRAIADRDEQRVWTELEKVRTAQHELRSAIAGIRLDASSELNEHISEHHHPLVTRVAIVEKQLNTLDNSISDLDDHVENSQVADRKKLEDQARDAARWWETGWGKVAIEVIKVVVAAAIGGGLVHAIK